MTTTDWLILLICSGVACFGAGMLTEAWTARDLAAAEYDDAEDEALALADGCHPDDHERGVHSPGVGA